MNKVNEYLEQRSNTVKWTCIGVLVFIMAFSLLVDKSHAHSWVEKYVPFFWSIFGFAAAAAIIGFARWYAHSGVMVSEDYYERTDSSSLPDSNEHA